MLLYAHFRYQKKCYVASRHRWQTNRSLCSATIKTYLVAVRNMQISLSLPDPCDSASMPMLKQVLAVSKGSKRTRAW